MENEERRGSSNAENFAWLTLGALVGVTAAVLLAPAKGSHTRRKLAGQAKARGQNFFDSSQDVIERARDLFEKGREIAQEASEMFERGRKMAEAGFDEQLEAEHHFDKGL